MTDTITTTDTRIIRKVRRLSTSGNITERECTTTVDARVKYYDARCSGLYVDLSPTSPATFWVKCTTSEGKQRPIKIGRFHPTELPIDKAREIADQLKVKVSQGQDVVAERHAARTAVRDGKTVDQVIELRVSWMQQLAPRAFDGAMRPRRKDWKAIARHLRNYVSPSLGTKAIRNVTRQDMIDLDQAIQQGTLIMANGKRCKASQSNARHVRRATSAMFTWAAKLGHVDASPCINLPDLDAARAKDRVLTDVEIKTLWHGLDRPMNWDRRTRLAIKFALVTMLRSWELLGAHKSELAVHDGHMPCLDVPADRVKKGRIINQPMTRLAMEIVKESMGNRQYLFAGRFGDDAPLSRQAMSGALTGTMKTVDGVRVTKSKGICELLGMAPFTPHDLRRTAATLAGRAGFSDAMIEYCLDHQKESKKTVGIYNRAERKNMAEKRAVLEAVEAKLREIIGLPVSDLLAA